MDIVYTEDEYRQALHRFLEICTCPKDENEVEELYRLVKVLENYEDRNCPYD